MFAWQQYMLALAEAYWRGWYRVYARTCGPARLEYMKQRRQTAKLLQFPRRG